jgi:hypothetical protein
MPELGYNLGVQSTYGRYRASRNVRYSDCSATFGHAVGKVTRGADHRVIKRPPCQEGDGNVPAAVDVCQRELASIEAVVAAEAKVTDVFSIAPLTSKDVQTTPRIWRQKRCSGQQKRYVVVQFEQLSPFARIFPSRLYFQSSY